jgi:xanthine/CO dehydrogenase XdhC/CoxF family maturation factor
MESTTATVIHTEGSSTRPAARWSCFKPATRSYHTPGSTLIDRQPQAGWFDIIKRVKEEKKSLSGLVGITSRIVYHIKHWS